VKKTTKAFLVCFLLYSFCTVFPALSDMGGQLKFDDGEGNPQQKLLPVLGTEGGCARGNTWRVSPKDWCGLHVVQPWGKQRSPNPFMESNSFLRRRCRGAHALPDPPKRPWYQTGLSADKTDPEAVKRLGGHVLAYQACINTKAKWFKAQHHAILKKIFDALEPLGLSVKGVMCRHIHQEDQENVRNILYELFMAAVRGEL